MHLKSIQYSEYVNQPKEWILSESTFGKISLIVGRNASGKTRTLNVINSLAGILRGERTALSSGDYDVNFVSGDKSYNLKLSMKDNVVTNEVVTFSEKTILSRDADGKGLIYTKEVNKNLSFMVPSNQFAAVVRRDPVQHEFLEPLHTWANSVVDYRFADDREKTTLVSFSKQEVPYDLQFNSIGLLKKGIDKFGDKFKSNLILDLKSIGYLVSDVGIKQPDDIIVTEGPPIHCLFVQETDLDCLTEQVKMSNGMFRALSLLIKLNYLLLDKTNPILSIDDIGEGLDFNRCKSLIDLIINKSVNENIQLIMSTNDQFVMNGVSLDYWAIADRQGSNVKIVNKINSPEIFDKFKFIGLNNFEFFASDFYK